MEHPYLTDWELYIVFCEYFKLQKIIFSSEIYNLLRKTNQLDTLIRLPFVKINPSYQNCHTNSKICIELSFTSRGPFYQWLEQYLNDYRNDKLEHTKQSFYPYLTSMNYSLAILKNTSSSRDSDQMCLLPLKSRRKALASIDVNKVRFYEDMLLLLRDEYIILDSIELESPQILTEEQYAKTLQPSFILNISQNKKFSNVEKSFLGSDANKISNISTSFVTLTTGNKQIQSSSKTSSPQIDYKKDFLPYNDMLVILYLASGHKYFIGKGIAKELFPALNQMKFLKVTTGDKKYIEKNLKKYIKPIQTHKMDIPPNAFGVIIKDTTEFNEYLRHYISLYHNSLLKNPNNYYRYNMSWDATIRFLNSLQVKHRTNYQISPQVIHENQDVLENKVTWMESLLKLVLDDKIKLNEVVLNMDGGLTFQFDISQQETLHVSDSSDIEYLGITITNKNEVWYKGYQIPIHYRRRQFIFLKYLVQLKDNYTKVTDPILGFRGFLSKELKDRGKNWYGYPDIRGIQDYRTQVKEKFEDVANSHNFTIDFHIKAGKNGIYLEPVSTKRKKRIKKLT